MSKSRGNLVALSDELAVHGVDAIRLTMVFAGPPEDDIDWADVSPGGSRKFLSRAWRLSGDVTSEAGVDPTSGDLALRKVTHQPSTKARMPSRRIGSTCWWPARWSWSTPPARRSTPARVGRSGCSRSRRSRRGHAVLGDALHGGGDVVAARP